MGRKKILVVDDERKVCDLVRAYLEKEDYNVVIATDGKNALEQESYHKPDLVLLDLNLPEIDGLEVCKILRNRSNVPIIMLTARDEETDRIIGLELGGDDYVTKPFSPREVVARVKAIFRRLDGGVSEAKQISTGDLYLDIDQHEASYAGRQLPLTPSEFKLLTILACNPGRVYTRLQLLDQAFGDAYEGYERTIDAHVKNIRQKMTKLAPEEPNPLLTVLGVGYKLEKQ
jgi:DNA-binding response OmpR family regulator